MKNNLSTACIHQLFERQVELSPDAIAVVFEGRSFGYAELNERANQLASYLQFKGVKPDTLVGICVNRSLEMMVALLAILKAGGAYVPFDPNYPQARLAFIADDTGIELLLTQHDLLDTSATLGCETFKLDTDWAELASYSTKNVVSAVSADHLAYVIYTSGSTGVPKGVMMQHDSVVNQLQWMVQYLQLNTADIVLQQTSISFDVSVLELFESLISGGKLIIAKPDGHRDTLYLVELIRSQKVTTMHLSPSMLQVYIDTDNFDSCVSLRQVCCAGEALPVSIANNFMNSSRGSLYNMYGPTEAAVIATSFAITAEVSGLSVSIGKPVNNTQIFILDDNHQPVADGEVGELYIGGVQLARGYLNREELTAERFIKGCSHLTKTGAIYKTGDLAEFLADGDIDYLRRVDHQIQLRGNRVEPGEIESCLRQHPGIENALVILQNDQYIAAYLVTNKPINNSEIRNFLGLTLPSYMLPSAFVTLKTFPLTINGKVDREALPEALNCRSKTDEDYRAPSNDREYELSKIWACQLQLDDCGIHDDFFAWGGNSLLAVKLTHQMEAVLSKELPIMYIFDNPTIAGVLQNIDSLNQLNDSSSLVKVRVNGDKKPLFYIGTTNYAHKLKAVLADDQPIYGLNIFGVKEAVNPDLPVTIEMIAQQFLAKIQKVQPTGPYQMASFCSDTLIAYEIAQQILQAGQSVSMFATIDTVWNEDPDKETLLNRLSYVTFSLVKHRFINSLKRFSKRLIESNKASADGELLTQYQRFLINFESAKQAYTPQKYAGEIVSFLSQEYSRKYNSTGLADFVINREDHQEYIINGFHDSLFEKPYLNDWVRILSTHLDT